MSYYVEKDLIVRVIAETYDMYKHILATIPVTCSNPESAKTTCDTIDNWLSTYNGSLAVRLGLDFDTGGGGDEI